MKRYDVILLNKLIDSYENSAVYRAKHRSSTFAADDDKPLRRRGIFCHIDKKTFPEYFDTTAGSYEVLHEQLQELEQKGLIRLYWREGKKDHILEKAALEIGATKDCYKYLNRIPRWKKEAAIEEICRRYYAQAEARHEDAECIVILTNFFDWINSRIENGESIKRYVDIDDPAGFERSCKLLLSILTNNNEMYLRQFSIAVFNDSKIAEKELDKAVSIIREFSSADDEYSDFSSDQILEMFGIFRNPMWMYMKGHVRISIDNENYNSFTASIDLKKLENGIGVTLRDLMSVSPDPAYPPDCILTVENLTSYYRQDVTILGRKALVIYLGGFAGRQKKNFLMKLHEAFPHTSFMHSGDIDCGGFRIWKYLCEGTGISFETYEMDVETFRKHANSGRPLTNQDRTDLGILKNDPFFAEQHDLFDLMLQTGIKLEQECFV